jgi:hypothetical protein
MAFAARPKVCDPVGVPEITPVEELIDRLAGKAPVAVKVYGVVPPEAVTVNE